jgi:peptidoglycan/LPS O-acetylase OafA/YrhL
MDLGGPGGSRGSAMPRPVEGTSAYNPGLDGIRAVAVLGVIAYHLGFGWAAGGLLGVEVFFVLSGYLITDLLVASYRRHQQTIQLGQFWLRRARRLLPALFVMLFAVVVWATLFNHQQLPALRSDLLPSIFYVSNWWFIFHHVSYFAQFGPPSPLGHLWSLAVEEQFYLFWPIIILAALHWVKDKWVIICGILVLAAASVTEMALLYSPLVDPTRVYDGTDTRAFALMFGAALAFAWPRDRVFRPITPGARRFLECVGGISLAGIIALYGFTSEFDPFVYRGGMVLLSVLTVLVVAVCVHPGARLSQTLGVAPLRWVGERSYGIYLWQYPVIILSTRVNAAPSYLRAVLQVIVILGASALSWRFIEQPVRHGSHTPLWTRAPGVAPGGRGPLRPRPI